MKYVHVPRELHTSDIIAEESCFSPGRYVRFIPPTQKSLSHYAPLDKLVLVRDEPVKAQKSETYHYAEIGDINIATGGITFREMKGFSCLLSDQPAPRTVTCLFPRFAPTAKALGLFWIAGTISSPLTQC